MSFRIMQEIESMSHEAIKYVRNSTVYGKKDGQWKVLKKYLL